MNRPELPVTRERDSLGKDRKEGGGMFARMFTIEGRREQLDEFARIGEKKVLPALRRLDGFGGLLVLTKRRNGKILVLDPLGEPGSDARWRGGLEVVPRLWRRSRRRRSSRRGEV